MTVKKCCPLWVIITFVMVLAAVAVTVYLILKKFHLLGLHYQPMDEGFWVEEDTVSESDSNGVRYTTDQDFV